MQSPRTPQSPRPPAASPSQESALQDSAPQELPYDGTPLPDDDPAVLFNTGREATRPRAGTVTVSGHEHSLEERERAGNAQTQRWEEYKEESSLRAAREAEQSLVPHAGQSLVPQAGQPSGGYFIKDASRRELLGRRLFDAFLEEQAEQMTPREARNVRTPYFCGLGQWARAWKIYAYDHGYNPVLQRWTQGWVEQKLAARGAQWYRRNGRYVSRYWRLKETKHITVGDVEAHLPFISPVWERRRGSVKELQQEQRAQRQKARLTQQEELEELRGGRRRVERGSTLMMSWNPTSPASTVAHFLSVYVTEGFGPDGRPLVESWRTLRATFAAWKKRVERELPWGYLSAFRKIGISALEEGALAAGYRFRVERGERALVGMSILPQHRVEGVKQPPPKNPFGRNIPGARS